ncbi:MAG: hypothetical protein ABIJ45_11460 [Candidatus Zixiibacteriota bacterium]
METPAYFVRGRRHRLLDDMIGSWDYVYIYDTKDGYLLWDVVNYTDMASFTKIIDYYYYPINGKTYDLHIPRYYKNAGEIKPGAALIQHYYWIEKKKY